MKKIPKDITHSIRGKSHFTLKGWPYGCLFLFMLLCCKPRTTLINYDAQYLQIAEVKPLLRSGDLIVRNGTDEVSRATRKFNRKDTSYSHCGIIQLENDSAFVYHALGGKYNPSQQLMRQPLDSFCNPAEHDKFAVFRYSLNDNQRGMLSKQVAQWYAQRLPFDMFFNFSSDDKMYCAEFVFKSYNAALNGQLSPLLRQKGEPVFVSVDDLYLNPFVTPVKTVIFKNPAQ